MLISILFRSLFERKLENYQIKNGKNKKNVKHAHFKVFSSTEIFHLCEVFICPDQKNWEEFSPRSKFTVFRILLMIYFLIIGIEK